MAAMESHLNRDVTSGADLENFMMSHMGRGSLVGVVKPRNSGAVCCGVGGGVITPYHPLSFVLDYWPGLKYRTHCIFMPFLMPLQGCHQIREFREFYFQSGKIRENQGSYRVAVVSFWK